MFRSIRWTLQLWHAGILFSALTIFGFALDFAVTRVQLRRVDAELEGAARILANGPPLGLFPDGDVRGLPPGFSNQNHPPWFNDNSPPDGFDSFPHPDNLPHFSPGDWWKEVPQIALRRLGENEQDQPYFVIWGMNNKILRSSPNCDVPLPPPQTTADSAPNGPVQFRQRDDLREAIVPGPFGIRVLVGKSMRSEYATVTRMRWHLVGAGAGVLIVGLCGGWVLARRATRPIQVISDTARAISASDLSRRIAVDETHSELGSLAQTLNDAFTRLETSFKRQIQFTADASHELRTPLSVIHSHTELALKKDRSAPEYKQTIQVCLRAAQRMKSLVESLLVLARADAHKLQLHTECFDLQDVAEECLALVSSRAHERRVTIEKQISSLAIESDRTRLAQLITNLLTNAIQYNRDGGRVTFAIVAASSNAVITVADTGVGIATADQLHIFERFFRADKARSREAGGSGLGLAICQSIVSALGGTIAFTSQSGEGTIFTIKLPLARLA